MMKSNAFKAMNFFGYAPVENPLPGLNVLLTLVHLLGTIAFFVYAFVDSSCDEVTVYKTDQPLSTCAGMLATFTCRTSDYDAATSTGHEKTLNNKNCLAEQTEAVYGWHPREKCSELVESALTCKVSETAHENYAGRTMPGVAKAACASEFEVAHPPTTSNTYYSTCEGTLMEPITLSSCDGFTNVCISTPLSVRMSQALAYSTSLMGLLALIYNFQCKRENQKKEGSPQQDGESL